MIDIKKVVAKAELVTEKTFPPVSECKSVIADLLAAIEQLEAKLAYGAEQFRKLNADTMELESEVKAGAHLVAEVGDRNRELELRVTELELLIKDAYHEGLHDAECEIERTDGKPTNGYQAMCWRASSARKALIRKGGD